MDRLGPFYLDDLPDDLAGYDELLFARLRDLVLKTGQAAADGTLRRRGWTGKLHVSVSAVPGQFRLMIVDGSGMAFGDDIAMLFLDQDGEGYVMLDRRVPASLIREVLDAEAPPN